MLLILHAAHLPSETNIQSVRDNINALSAAGALTNGLTGLQTLLAGQSTATVNDAYDQLHPAPYSAFVELQEEMGAKIISLFHRKPHLPNVDFSPVRLWLTPFGDSLTEKEHGEQFGLTANSGGVAIGVDGNIADNWVFGFGGAWNDSYLEWHRHHGHGNVNCFYGAIYTDLQFWDFYLGGSAYGGIDFYDTSRHIHPRSLDEHAKASFTGYDIVAQLAMAYYFGAETAFFYPYANFDFLFCHKPSITEHGSSLNLNVNGNTASTFRTEMGLAFQMTDLNYNETMGITPSVSIGWVNMTPIERQHYTANFAGAPLSFTTHGWDQTWNLFSLDFALGYFYKSFSIDVEYNVEMSADEKTLLYNQFANLSFQWTF